ncbi:NAD-dependent epimerase/dehydratase family protein [Methylomonas rhizoryzae]|uniref:NAD-dependent epimerase/dehydratase family protein n=1 Tax=Methylomonas rhizoryzae TaxID=2608981 RepID=UPI001231876C|nr:NAD-dependent epimerase/dehydratase family protein [Methylomonas rhizoryzae]
MTNILLIGCGDIGLALANALAARGYRVTAVKRSPLKVPVDFSVLLADICRPASIQRLPTDFRLVIYVVAPDQRDDETYRALYYAAVDNVLQHFARFDRKPKWLFVSSTSVYGQNHGEWVDEKSPAQPASATGRCLLAAENLLYQDSDKHCVVRFSGIYGPGRNRLAHRAAGADAVQYQPAYFSNRIHRDDCVGVLLFLSEKLLAGDLLQSCYLASDDEPAPIWDVLCWIADLNGYPRPQALELAVGSAQNKRCSNRRLRELGYRFLYPSYKDGYR